MARISGIDLPIAKRIEIALTYIFGIGRPKAQSILTRAKVDFGTKVRDLTEEEVGRIRRVITVRRDGRRRSPQEYRPGHQAADGHRLLPGAPPPQGAARPRPTHAH